MTTLPPSSGSTGRRLNAPIAGPAHHTAAAAGELPRSAASSGLTPIASEHSDPGEDVGDRAGEGDHRLGPPRQRLRGVVGGVAGQEVERDLRLGPCPAGGDGVAELVQQREAGDRDGQPHAELVAVDGDDQHHEQQEARPHVDREPEHAHRQRSYELIIRVFRRGLPCTKHSAGVKHSDGGSATLNGATDALLDSAPVAASTRPSTAVRGTRSPRHPSLRRQRYVYAFDHKHRRPPMEMKDLLGGKGANLAEMTSVLKLPVPAGFTISTDACRAYMAGGWPAGLDDEIATHVATLERKMGRRLGDPSDPLLVSVRSGAKFSMPGMMDTVLNLGLNDKSVKGLATGTNDERFAYDSYRRFISMYGRIVLGIDGDRFEHPLEDAKARRRHHATTPSFRRRR